MFGSTTSQRRVTRIRSSGFYTGWWRRDLHTLVKARLDGGNFLQGYGSWLYRAWSGEAYGRGGGGCRFDATVGQRERTCYVLIEGNRFPISTMLKSIKAHVLSCDRWVAQSRWYVCHT
ncbi:hypothetical protein ACLB2K_019249 [Fragaria x ananassa]